MAIFLYNSDELVFRINYIFILCYILSSIPLIRFPVIDANFYFSTKYANMPIVINTYITVALIANLPH